MTTSPTTYEQDGEQAGKAAGSWVIDGNTSEATCARIIAGFNDGDPEIMDIEPSPLSGEWAGESISELICGYNDLSPEDQDEACTLYEQGFSRGFWDEVIRAASCQLQPTS